MTPAPATYGDVTAEYQALIEGAAIVPRQHDLLWVEGPDTVAFLQGIVSQNVETMELGTVARSLLLSPQGKPVALLWLLRGHERVGVVTDAGFGEKVAETLGYYRIRVRVEIRVDQRPITEVWGARAGELTGIEDGWLDDDTGAVMRLPLAISDRVVVAGRFEPGTLPRAGMLAATALRIEAGEPVMGKDIDQMAIPHETGLVEAAVDLGKGCFLGYELVERVESRGRNTPRRLWGVAVTTNLLPPEGAEVWKEGDRVGGISSVAESLRVGTPVALGLLKRGLEAGDAVELRWEGGSAPAQVRALPLIAP